MDTSAFADSVYQPEPGEIQEDTGVLASQDTLLDRGLEDPLDEGYSPPERPLELNRYGLTAAEARAGETLDQRLAQEEPEAWEVAEAADSLETDYEADDHEVGGRRSGRLVAVDAGLDSVSTAQEVGIAGGAASAEEAAMHVIEDDERW